MRTGQKGKEFATRSAGMTNAVRKTKHGAGAYTDHKHPKVTKGKGGKKGSY